MRYSKLAPLSHEMRAKLARSALKFFSPMTQQETLPVLGRQPNPQGTAPLGGFDFLRYLENSRELPEAMKYANVIRQLLETMASTGWLMQMGPSGNALMPMSYYYLKENTTIEQKGLFTLQHQCALALGRPAFDLFFHLHTHRLILHYDVSRISLGHYRSSIRCFRSMLD